MGPTCGGAGIGDCGLDLFKHDKAEADNQLRAFRAGHWLAQTCQFPPWLFCLFGWLFLFLLFCILPGLLQPANGCCSRPMSSSVLKGLTLPPPKLNTSEVTKIGWSLSRGRIYCWSRSQQSYQCKIPRYSTVQLWGK